MNTHTGVHDKGDTVYWNGMPAKVLAVSQPRYPGDPSAGDELLIELPNGEQVETQRWHLDKRYD